MSGLFAPGLSDSVSSSGCIDRSKISDRVQGVSVVALIAQKHELIISTSCSTLIHAGFILVIIAVAVVQGAFNIRLPTSTE